MKNTKKAKTETRKAKTLTAKQKAAAKRKTAQAKNPPVAKGGKGKTNKVKEVALKGATVTRLQSILDSMKAGTSALSALVAVYVANGLTAKSEAKQFAQLNKRLKARLVTVKGKALTAAEDVQFRNLARSAKLDIIPAKKKAAKKAASKATANQKTKVLQDHRTSIDKLEVADFAKHIVSEVAHYAKENKMAKQDVIDSIMSAL